MARRNLNQTTSVKAMWALCNTRTLIVVVTLFLSACFLVGCGSSVESTRSSTPSSSLSSKVDFVGTWFCIGFLVDGDSFSIQEMDEEYGTDTTYCIVLEKDGTFYSLYMNGIDEPFATDGTWERASDGILVQPGNTEGVYRDDGLLYIEDGGLVGVFQKVSDDTVSSRKGQ